MEKFVNDRLQIYKSLGVNFRILTTTFSNEKQDGLGKRDNCYYVKQYTPYNYTPKIKKYFSDDYDLISINQVGRYFSDRAILYYGGIGKKIVLTPHFTFHTQRFSTLKKIHTAFVINQVLLKCTKVICFTEYEKDYWNSIHRVPNEKLHVIPHYFERIGLERYEYYEDGKYLFYLGRADRNKKLDLFIHSFHALKDTGYKLKLTVNISDLSVASREIVSKYNRIELLGYISDDQKNDYLRNCSAVIYPSEFEAFGHALLEGSNFKKPILCSNIEVFNEILDQRGTIFFDNSPGGIKDALLKFYELGIEEKKIMGEYNYERLDRYSFATILEKYRALFDELGFHF
ncbi:MAG: glycosyltransferase family 4 protein [Bacteroidetes bacterium]|nr:glycosyltransferase family 4 protein [Bacteroidota bacterium]